MLSTLIEIGPLGLPTYATLLSLGLVGGTFLAVWEGRRRELGTIPAFDAALVGASGGLIGARVAYAAVNWAFFRDHLVEALQWWAGGLAWQGGLVLGLSLIFAYAARQRLPVATLLDALAPGMAWFALFIWLGSAAANDIYGRESWPTERLWWYLSADLPDLYGLRAPRVNVVLMGILWSGLVLWVVWLLRDRLRRAGSLFLLFLAFTGAGGLLLVPLQANPAPFVLHVRVDWWFYLLLLVGGVVGLSVPLVLRARGTPTASGD